MSVRTLISLRLDLVLGFVKARLITDLEADRGWKCPD